MVFFRFILIQNFHWIPLFTNNFFTYHNLSRWKIFQLQKSILPHRLTKPGSNPTPPPWQISALFWLDATWKAGRRAPNLFRRTDFCVYNFEIIPIIKFDERRQCVLHCGIKDKKDSSTRLSPIKRSNCDIFGGGPKLVRPWRALVFLLFTNFPGRVENRWNECNQRNWRGTGLERLVLLISNFWWFWEVKWSELSLGEIITDWRLYSKLTWSDFYKIVSTKTPGWKSTRKQPIFVTTKSTEWHLPHSTSLPGPISKPNGQIQKPNPNCHRPRPHLRGSTR